MMMMMINRYFSVTGSLHLQQTQRKRIQLCRLAKRVSVGMRNSSPKFEDIVYVYEHGLILVGK
jgi:hypothetical protein